MGNNYLNDTLMRHGQRRKVWSEPHSWTNAIGVRKHTVQINGVHYFATPFFSLTIFKNKTLSNGIKSSGKKQ
ncbi:hypothetical protein AAHA92_07698 [Salvia divinorum]|uniref:Ribosomal protein S19 n=1 Tax=Salvia divinorum TaxID=28513 RepID=A0ABD1I9U7_SALDI